MKVPFIDLRRKLIKSKSIVADVFERISDSGVFMDGAYTAELESKTAKLYGRHFGVAFGCGTDAAIAGLRALKSRRDGKALICAHSFVAEGLACLQSGLPMALCDMDPANGQISPAAAEKVFKRGDAAGLYLCHLHGIPADVEALAKLAKDRGAWIFEDFVQSTGASVSSGGKLGTFGDVSICSFYPTKPTFGIDTGAVLLTDDPSCADYCRRARLFGLGPGGVSVDPVLHSGISELSAGVAAALLDEAPIMLRERTLVCRQYDRSIDGAFRRLQSSPGDVSACHHYIIYVQDRPNFIRELAAKGIGAGVYYPATLDEHHWPNGAIAEVGDIESARKHAACNVALPLWEGMSPEQVSLVIETVNSLTQFALE